MKVVMASRERALQKEGGRSRPFGGGKKTPKWASRAYGMQAGEKKTRTLRRIPKRRRPGDHTKHGGGGDPTRCARAAPPPPPIGGPPPRLTRVRNRHERRLDKPSSAAPFGRVAPTCASPRPGRRTPIPPGAPRSIADRRGSAGARGSAPRADA